MRILMIEDEKKLAEAVGHILKKNNYSVDLAFDGEEGLDLSLLDIYDAIILDIMLPKINGLSILEKLRANDIKTPIILLTAKSEVDDKVTGLDLGADDYLTKPFQTDELLARLRALMRRKEKLIDDSVIEYGNVTYNQNSLELTVDDKGFKLTLKEAHLLELLINRKEKIIPKEVILDKLWGFDECATLNNVEVYVSFLRKKLDSLKANIMIETIRGVGYRLLMR